MQAYSECSCKSCKSCKSWMCTSWRCISCSVRDGGVPLVRVCMSAYAWPPDSSGVQGACVHPPPALHGHVPLKQLHSGQCLVQVASGFIGWLSDAAPDVWVHNLYIRGPTSGWANSGPHRHIALQWRPQQAAALWLTNTTVDGGMMGVLFHGASAYAEGDVPVARYHPPGVKRFGTSAVRTDMHSQRTRL